MPPTLTLLRRYELPDPAAGNAIGLFTDPDLQQMIRRAEGEDYLTPYRNLLEGSRSHLRTFHRLLTRAGTAYEPLYLSEEEYREIVDSPRERGLVDLSGELVCGGRGHRLGSG